MTNKEIKRASYIYFKRDAGVELTETEEQFLREHEEEYLQTDYHKQRASVDATNEKILREKFKISEDIDINKLMIANRRRYFRSKFPDRLKPLSNDN